MSTTPWSKFWKLLFRAVKNACHENICTNVIRRMSCAGRCTAHEDNVAGMHTLEPWRLTGFCSCLADTLCVEQVKLTGVLIIKLTL